MKKRFAVLSRQDVPLFDLDVDAMAGEGAVRMERLKGEHKLDVTTTQKLDEGMRILSRDGTLKWREWCVDEPQDDHDADGMLHAYGCTWSMQYDLATVNGGELWPGTYSPITAGAALAMVLGVQSRWEVGNVTVTGTAGTSLYDGQVWDYLGILQEVWGGEMEPRIEVGADGVVHRYVDWLAHVGQTEATRRFDFGEDCTSIHRKEAPGPRFCRVVPRGGRDAQDADGIRYSDRCGVDEEPYREDATGEFVHPANAYYIEDTVAAQLFRTPDGAGGWHYPEKVVCYDLDLAGDQEELLNKAMAEVADHTRPKTTYEADVLQFVAAGMDAHGVALGDEVQIVDKKFGDVALRLQARIVEMTVNELDETDVHLVIGEPNADLASSFKSLVKSIDSAEGRAREIQAGGTIAYVESLLDAINAQIAADGGYTYLVNGQGNITYDKAVANPFIGAEATQVTQMKGGSLRFANSKKPAFQDIDDWDWKTVITSEGFLGLAATIAAITTGFIGSSDNVVFIDLDNRRMQIGNAATLGGRTVQQLLSDVDSAGVDSIEYGTSASSGTEPTTWSTTAPTSVAKGSWLWIRTTYKDGGTSTTKAYAGTDGTSVSILGSYNTLAELEAAHPTGSVGDGYIVAGDLYVWDGSSWLDVGRIQGPAGQDGTSVTIASREVRYAKSDSGTTAPTSGWQADPPSTVAGEYLWSRTVVNYSDGTNTTTYNVAGHGADGTSVAVTKTEYGTSASASTQPETWTTTPPTSIAKGTWQWTRVTFSNGSTATNKSYAGTDGEDGTSTYIKSWHYDEDTGVTTLVVTDGTQDATLTISDGEDGTNGLGGYVHTAWANSADGRTDFSTTVSAGKSYLGVYTDNAQADSQSPSAYSWSLIKGANGGKGDKGDKGDTGDAARAYSIVISPDTLKRDGDTITPSELTVSATVAVGTATPTIYMGRFSVEEYDGSAWSTKYTSSGNESSKTYQPTSTARMVRCTLFAAGGTTTRLDSQTVPVLADGADGIDGTDGTDGQDAYSVWLTNDSHVFPASGSAALAGSVSTYVKVYRGSTLVRPVTIGTLPTPPTGMTLTRLNNGSSTADAGLRIDVTTALTTRSGTIDVPVTADGRTFTVTLSWALALEGVGIKSVVPQYYLSTSSSSATGGSWSSTPPTWQANRYIWTRNFITWDSNPVRTSTTDEVYDAALTQANQQAVQAIADAEEAAKVATNYLTFDQTNGLDVGYQGTNAKTRINGSGVEIFDESGTSMTKVQSGKMRIGESNKTRAEIDWHSLQLIDRYDNTYMYVSDFSDDDGYATITDTLLYWNGGTCYLTETALDSNYTIKINGVDRTSEFKRYTQYFYYDGSGSLAYGTVLNVTYRVSINRTKAYTFGLRKTNSPLGIMSLAEGYLTEASGAGSHAEGYYSQAAGIASHAEGGFPSYYSNPYWTQPDLTPDYPSRALGIASHAESGGIAKGPCSRAFFRGTANGFASVAHGINALADGSYAYAIGPGTIAYHYQFVYGSYNVQSDSQVFTIGIGSSSSSRATGFYVSNDGNGWFKGSCTATSHPTSSDKRLKKHVEYIGDDMCDFIRALKPVRYRWKENDDGEHYGFYAQDVQEADPYDTATVTSVEDGNLDFDPLTLDYTALIAPLTAYTQQLERRIDEQQEMIERLTKRLDALEGR